MGKQPQHGSVFFWKFWASQCVSQNSLFVKSGLSPPSEGRDMWVFGENDKQTKSACEVQVKVSELYNNCNLRGAIYVSRKTQKGPTFRQPSQLPTFLLYRHPVAANGLTTESLVVGKISSKNNFFFGTMVEGKSGKSLAQSSAFVHHLKEWDLIWGPVERASEQMQSLYSWTLDIYLAIVAILWGHANAIGHTSTKLYYSFLPSYQNDTPQINWLPKSIDNYHFQATECSCVFHVLSLVHALTPRHGSATRPIKGLSQSPRVQVPRRFNNREI